MRFRVVFWLAVLASWLHFSTCSVSGQEMVQKRRVTLLNFEDYTGTVSEAVKVFGADVGDAGKGISALLLEKLNAGGKYTLVDQSAVSKLLKEQNSSDDDRLDVYGRAAKIGRMLGLDAMIVGAITRFGPDASQRDAGGSHSGISTRKSKAFVAVTARVLNMTTAEVIAEFTAAGESTGTGQVMRFKLRGHSHEPQEILGSEFVDGLLAEATRNAVEKIAGQLNNFAEKIPIFNIEFDGLVAEVAGNSVTLNLGRNSGLKVGDKLAVVRELRATIDPQTGTSLPPAVEHIGEVTVTDVAGLYATAVFSGPGQAQVGDRVQSLATPQIPSH